MSDNPLFVYVLDYAALLWILLHRKKISEVNFVILGIDAWMLRFISTVVPSKQVSEGKVNLVTPSYFDFERRIYRQNEQLFEDMALNGAIKKIVKPLPGTVERYLKAIKRMLLADNSVVYQDYMIAQVARAACPDGEKVSILIREHRLLQHILNDNSAIGIERLDFYDALLTDYKRSLSLLLKGGLFFLGRQKNVPVLKGEKINYILEGMYSEKEGNVEFGVFYDYFKEREDVLYVLPRGNTQTYNRLQRDGKPVILRNTVGGMLRKRGANFHRYVRLVAMLLLSRDVQSISLKNAILSTAVNSMYYDALFGYVRPKYYLKVRFDMEASHPVATAVAEQHGVYTIGYMHASYGGFYTIFSNIDFHYYGLIGRGFKERIYSEYWNNSIKYKVLGPIAAEARASIRDEGTDRLPVVGVFLRAIAGNVGDYSCRECISSIWKVLFDFGIPNMHLVFKEHSRKGWFEELKDSLSMEYPLSYETFYHYPLEEKKYLYAGDVIAMSDIVVSSSYAYSTIAFEALSQKKKIAVLLQRNIPPHPLEDCGLPLVSRSDAGLQSSLRWLIETPQAKYEQLIDPVIKEWSKVSNAGLVREFIESFDQPH